MRWAAVALSAFAVLISLAALAVAIYRSPAPAATQARPVVSPGAPAESAQPAAAVALPDEFPDTMIVAARPTGDGQILGPNGAVSYHSVLALEATLMQPATAGTGPTYRCEPTGARWVCRKQGR